MPAVSLTIHAMTKQKERRAVKDQAKGSFLCVRVRFAFCWSVHEGHCTIEIGPNPEDSVEPRDTENFCAIWSDIAEEQTTMIFSHQPVEIHQGFKYVTRKELNGLTVENDLSALTGIDNGNGFLDRICIE